MSAYTIKYIAFHSEGTKFGLKTMLRNRMLCFFCFSNAFQSRSRLLKTARIRDSKLYDVSLQLNNLASCLSNALYTLAQSMLILKLCIKPFIYRVIQHRIAGSMFLRCANSVSLNVHCSKRIQCIIFFVVFMVVVLFSIKLC